VNALVVGAGATGLALAYVLRRAGHGVTLVEGSDRAGGLLATFDVGGGARLERYYHHFFTHDAELHWLLGELGLSDRVVYRRTSMGVFRGGQVYPFDGARDVLRFRAIGLPARLRFGLSSAMLAYLPGYLGAEDRSALAWFGRWAGRSATGAVWRPMLEVKFDDAAPRVPLAWMAGRLRQRVHSRSGGAEKLGYLAGSLQVLVDRLTERLGELGARVCLGTPVRRLVTDAGRVAGVETAEGVLTADAVVATVPTPVLAGLVEPLDGGYARDLRRVEYLGAVCTVLALRERLSPVYWLNVADPGYDFGGVIEQTNFVPPGEYGGRHLVYLSRYLPAGHPLGSAGDDEITARQVGQLGRLFGRDVGGILERSWVFRARHAAPRTELGFHRLVPAFRSPLPGLFVAAMPHVYPDERSVNNSVRVAAEAARAMGLDEAADAVPRGMSLAAKYGGSARG
jgi:protoporphyrinogen oxidase